MNSFTKQKQTHRHRKQTHGCGRVSGGINQKLGINRYADNNRLLLCIYKIDNQQGPTV